MRRATAAALAAAVLLLAGCSDIPTSGTVQPGTTEAPNGTSIVYKPNKPAAGASPKEIVAGFLTAASGGGSFKVAKEYLTDDFAEKWDPTTQVLVQGAQTAITTGTSQNLRVDVPLSAEVDSTGEYHAASGSASLPFHLVQVAGQWRIDSAQDGIVLSQPVFQQRYVPLALQFFDSTWTHLVPDRRWFPSTDTRGSAGPDPKAVVAALIAGPAGPLGGTGVASNALASASVSSIDPSSSDVTTIALSVKGTAPTAAATGRMQQQLIQSLGLPTPSALRLIVNGSLAPQVKQLADQLTPLPFVLTGGRFGTLSASGAFTDEKTLGPRIAATHPSAVTVSLGQKTAAVLTGSDDVAIVGTTLTKVVDSRPGLIAPTIDQRGWVYSVPTDSPGGLQAANGKRTVDLGGSDLTGATVTAIQASPDGTRMLVLVQSPSGPRAYVAGIERTADGTPTGLTTAPAQYKVDLGGSAGTGSSATWIDDGSVAVLINGQDTDRVRSQQLGGLSAALGQFANVSTIVGTTGLDDLRIRVGGGLYVWNDSNWQQESTSTAVQVLAVQR